MNITNSLSNAQAIMLLVFALVVIWVGIKLAAGKAARGDLGGTASTVGAMLGPMLLVAIGVAAVAVSLGSGLLDGIGIATAPTAPATPAPTNT